METLIPPAMQAILAAPPLVPGEDEADYHRMVAQLGAESGAATTYDWFMVKDVADLTWQIARIRRWVSAYAVSGRGDGPAGAAEHRTGDAPPISRSEAIQLVGSMYDTGDDGEFRALIAGFAASPQPDTPAHAHAFFRNLASRGARIGMRKAFGPRRMRVPSPNSAARNPNCDMHRPRWPATSRPRSTRCPSSGAR